MSGDDNSGISERKGAGHSFSRWKVVAGVIGVILVVLLVGWLTMSLEPALPAKNGVVYPFSAKYDMIAPDGQSLMIGNVLFRATTQGNDVALTVGNSDSVQAVGEMKTILEKRALVKTFGIAVFDTNYRLDATYKGKVNGNPDFDLTIMSSAPIPQFLIDRMLPTELVITPRG